MNRRPPPTGGWTAGTPTTRRARLRRWFDTRPGWLQVALVLAAVPVAWCAFSVFVVLSPVLVPVCAGTALVLWVVRPHRRGRPAPRVLRRRG